MDYKIVRITKRSKPILHVEAPGCVVNIRHGLRDAQGRSITRVDVIAEVYGDGSPDDLHWEIVTDPPILGEGPAVTSTSAWIQVREVKQESK